VTEDVIIFSVGVHEAIVLAVCEPRAAVKLATPYRQFLEKNFEQYLIICSSGSKHV